MTSVRSIGSDFGNLAATIQKHGRDRRLIGFDVFDTLLRRRIEPETVKDLSARHLTRQLTGLLAISPLRTWGMPDWKLLREKRRVLEIEMGEETERAGGDHEFRLRDMVTRWVSQCVPPTVPLHRISEISAATVAHEIKMESCATLPTSHIVLALETARLCAKRLVYVSDSYMSDEDIRFLLGHNGLLEFFDDGYVSSEYMLTKRSGRLFDKVIAEESLAPRDFLFIGDNQYSDRDSAARVGIQSILVRDTAEKARRTQLQLVDQLSRNNSFWVARHQREIVKALPTRLFANPRDASSPHYHLGTFLAPSFMAFTLHILEEAKSRGLRKVFFLSREGLTFIKMYRRIVRALGCKDQAPEAEYLVVSRASTFLASNQTFDIQALERIWWQYQGQSLARILKNFSLPVEEFGPLAISAGVTDLDAPISNLHACTPLRAFFELPETQRLFALHRDNARDLLTRYFTTRGWFASSGDPAGTVGVVDIGWKGSIQSNIHKAFETRSDAPAICGFYFGLTRDLQDESVTNQRIGYMADTKNGDWLQECIFKNGSVFEMFSTAMHGGAAGYVERANGTVKATIKLESTERENFNSHFADVKRGIDDYVDEMIGVLPLLDAASADLRPGLLDQLRRYILYPTHAEAKAFLEYTHVENFGVFKVSDYGWKGSWKKILRGSPKDLPHRLLHELRQQLWQEGIVKRSRVPLGNLLYDLIETRRASKW